MQQAPGLTTLPIEVLENIISYIDRPYDLLGLALTRKYFCFIIIPSHLSLRRVVLKLQDPSPWKDLSERSYFFLERMRELRVVFSKRTNWIDEAEGLNFPLYIDSHSPELASWYDLDDLQLREALSTYFDCLETILKKSERLFSFSIHYDYPIDRQVGDHLLSHLSSSSLLKELEISSSPLTQVNSTHIIPSLRQSRAFDISSLNFPRLSVLSLTITGGMEGFRTLIEGPILNWFHLSDILLVSKTEVYLSSTNFFSRGRWPFLKRLTVDRFRIDTDESVTTMLQAFFQRHQTLERLSLAEYHRPTSLLGLWDKVQPARDLPSLKSLYFQFGDDFSIPLTLFNQLEHATVFGNITSEGDCPIPKAFPLKSLVYGSSCPSHLMPGLGKALQKTPVLERLAFECSNEVQMRTLFPIILNLKNLTHLQFTLLDCNLTPWSRTIYLRTLSKLLALRYVGFQIQKKPTQWFYRDIPHSIQIPFRALPVPVSRRAKSELCLVTSEWGSFFMGRLPYKSFRTN